MLLQYPAVKTDIALGDEFNVSHYWCMDTVVLGCDAT